MLSTLGRCEIAVGGNGQANKTTLWANPHEHQIARSFYELELFSDGQDRDAGNVEVRANSLFIKYSSKGWIDSLNTIVAGLANDNTIEVMLGPIFDKLAASGHFNAAWFP